MTRHRLAPWLLAAAGGVVLAPALPLVGARARGEEREEATVVVAAEGDPAPAAALPAPGPLGPMRWDPALGRWVAPLGGGRAILTLDPKLQEKLTRALADHRVPWGATVLLEPRSGRVLALAEHSQRERDAAGLATRALGPAASVFKIVTAAALLERGVEPDEQVCYHGGRHRIAPRHLSDDPRRDRRCLTLEAAMGQSANLVFAKLADRGLTSELLRAQADRWLFNAPIPFAGPVEISRAEIPDDPFALASTAAGFGAVRLSPLHAALIAEVVANGGVLVPPEVVDAVEGVPAPLRQDPRRIVEEPVAEQIARMMRRTTSEGTARKVFRGDRRSRRSPLREVTVAGKTGSLADRSPFRDYSWFVGFAPADDPQVVVAAVVVNERLWRVKAPWVAHHALEAFFAGGAARPVAGAGVAGPAPERRQLARSGPWRRAKGT